MSELLTPHVSLGAKADGRFVEVTIGNRSFTLDYDTAFRFAVLIFGNAKIAKRNVGDHSRMVYGFANLTDASMDELKAQRSRDNTAMFIRAGGSIDNGR
jgi:hypothetical protein